MNPMKHTTGATLIRVGEKISSLKDVSVLPLPAIRMNPVTITAIEAASMM